MTRKSAAQPPESPIAESATDVQYLGRKTSRQGSEQRRQAILDASMRIIVRDGVRAIRHRAVAAEAQVPLSATTYYFKDIDDLIIDTFALFIERSAANMAAFWLSVQAELERVVRYRESNSEVLQVMVDYIVRMTVDYVHSELIHGRDRLMAEQALRVEALINPRLHDLVNAHRKILWSGVDKLFEAMGSPQPFEDAQAFVAIVLRMEYQGLLDGMDNLDLDEWRAVLTRYLCLVMKL